MEAVIVVRAVKDVRDWGAVRDVRLWRAVRSIRFVRAVRDVWVVSTLRVLKAVVYWHWKNTCKHNSLIKIYWTLTPIVLQMWRLYE